MTVIRHDMAWSVAATTATTIAVLRTEALLREDPIAATEAAGQGYLSGLALGSGTMVSGCFPAR